MSIGFPDAINVGSLQVLNYLCFGSPANNLGHDQRLVTSWPRQETVAAFRYGCLGRGVTSWITIRRLKG